VKPTEALPDPPAHLGEIAAAKWRELIPLVDRPAPPALTLLEIYATNYQRWYEAQGWLDEHGDVLELLSDKGVVIKVMPAPKLDVAARAERAMAEAIKGLRLRAPR